jgi:hypothetical protein
MKGFSRVSSVLILFFAGLHAWAQVTRGLGLQPSATSPFVGAWDLIDTASNGISYPGTLIVSQVAANGSFAFTIGGAGGFIGTGTSTGSNLTLNGTYRSLTARWVGVLDPTGTRIDGTWTQSDGQVGTWTATRQGPPPGTPPTLTITLDQYNVPPSDTTPRSVPRVVNTVSASVALTDGGGAPVPNAVVDFKGQPASLAVGGHNHSDTSALEADFFTDGFSAVNSCTTLSDGKCSLTYIVPIAGGGYSLSAWLNTDSSVSDQKSLSVQVPGLVALGSGGCPPPVTGNTYTLTGCTTTHQSSNHYGSPVMVSRVQALASAYYASISALGAILDINDMSLPFGGIFDICVQGSELGCAGASPWNRPHNLHRDGHSMDINHHHRDGTRVKEALLKRIATQLGFYPVTEPNIHYELP